MGKKIPISSHHERGLRDWFETTIGYRKPTEAEIAEFAEADLKAQMGRTYIGTKVKRYPYIDAYRYVEVTKSQARAWAEGDLVVYPDFDAKGKINFDPKCHTCGNMEKLANGEWGCRDLRIRRRIQCS